MKRARVRRPLNMDTPPPCIFGGRGVHLLRRVVIFAQIVNDPGYQQGAGFTYGKNKKDAAADGKRLFKIIEELVQWENSTNEEVLSRARAEIRRSWREVCEL